MASWYHRVIGWRLEVGDIFRIMMHDANDQRSQICHQHLKIVTNIRYQHPYNLWHMATVVLMTF